MKCKKNLGGRKDFTQILQRGEKNDSTLNERRKGIFQFEKET